MFLEQPAKHTMEKIKFNSDINILGSIPDYEVLFLALKGEENENSQTIEEELVNNNKFNFRTESSRTRFLKVIQSTILKFRNEQHRQLITTLFRSENLEQTKQFALMWQIAANNDLFFALMKNLFLKQYFSGRVSIKRTDVEAYISHLLKEIPKEKRWSKKTLETSSSKYLTLLKKINFLKGRQTKEFVHLQVNKETLVFFIYFMKAINPDIHNLFNHPLLDFAFMSQDAFMESTKRIELLEYYDYSYTGTSLSIEPKYKFEEIINVLSNRT